MRIALKEFRSAHPVAENGSSEWAVVVTLWPRQLIVA